MNTEYNLFLDMDGVIVDFDGGYEKLAHGLNAKDIASQYGEKTARDVYLEAGLHFWANLEWLYGGQELWEASNKLFQNIYILSSGGTTNPERAKMVETGKRLWLKKNIPNLTPENIIIVMGKHLKPDYATKTSILVDDVSITIRRCNDRGGYGILHNCNHYEKTIEELEDISRPIKLSELIKRFKK